MASEVLDVCDELNSIVGGHRTRSAPQPHEIAVRSAQHAASRWIFLGIGATAIGALALLLLNHAASIRSDRPDATASLPASLYFDAAHAALDATNLESIVAIARALRSSPTPVVVAAYAAPLGSREQNLRIAQKRGASVRDALVKAGVPTSRVVLVSPAFAATNDPARVEISVVHGVRAFPPQRLANAQ